MLQTLFRSADQYLEESNWKDLALIKCCLCAMGVVLGASVPGKHRLSVTSLAAGTFVATYIPLMAKFFRIVRQQRDCD